MFFAVSQMLKKLFNIFIEKNPYVRRPAHFKPVFEGSAILNEQQ